MSRSYALKVVVCKCCFLFSVSGCTDHLAANETEAFTLTRDIVTSFNIDPVTQIRGDDPLFSINDLPGLIPSNPQISIDAKKVNKILITLED